MNNAQPEVRKHHPYSPSTLQNTEACPCYQSRDSQHERSIAGTLAHEVVETGDDKHELSDEDAMAAAECIEFRENRKAELQAAADKALPTYLKNGGDVEFCARMKVDYVAEFAKY